MLAAKKMPTYPCLYLTIQQVIGDLSFSKMFSSQDDSNESDNKSVDSSIPALTILANYKFYYGGVGKQFDAMIV